MRFVCEYVGLCLQPLDNREATRVWIPYDFLNPCEIMLVYSVEKPNLEAFTMPDRFRTDVAYFMTPAGEQGAPALGEREYWIRLEDALQWLEDGVVSVVSPLDAAAKAEIELTEEQEAFLDWLVENRIQHVKLGD